MVLKYPMPEGFSGTLEIEMMSYPDRNRLRKEVGLFGVGKKSADEMTEDEKLKSSLENLEVMAMVAEKVKPLFKEVSVTMPSGQTISGVDDLYAHPECEDLLTTIVGKFLFGFVEKN